MFGGSWNQLDVDRLENVIKEREMGVYCATLAVSGVLVFLLAMTIVTIMATAFGLILLSWRAVGVTIAIGTPISALLVASGVIRNYDKMKRRSGDRVNELDHK